MLNLVRAQPKHYAEVHQSYPLLFAWVRRDGNDLTMQHSWIKCRDFLPDAIMLHNRKDYKEKIYGFGIDKDFRPEPYLALKFPNLQYKSNFYNNMWNIRKIEWANKIEKPLQVLLDADDVLVVEFDPFWLKHPSLVSLYTFLMKVYSYTLAAGMEGAASNEQEYIMATQQCLDKLLANLGNLTYGPFDNGMTLGQFHYHVGFVSTYKKSSTHFLRMELMKL